MQQKHKIFFSAYVLLVSLWMIAQAHAGTPLWTFEPLTPTTVTVPSNASVLVQYRVTNQSSKTHTLQLQPLGGVTQVTTGLGICGSPFTLIGKNSCILSLKIQGDQLKEPLIGGPVLCQQGSQLQCYRPSAANSLQVTPVPPLNSAVLTVTGSPLTLTVNGSGQLTINNTSLEITATNISSNFTGTALDGNVSETGNTCASVPPSSSCQLTFTAGNKGVPPTNFPIKGSNTNTITATIAVASGSTLISVNPNSGSAAGGLGVTLTGTGLTGATGVTFGGVAATSVNVINSTTVTAVTPPNSIGTVNVAIDTPAGGAILGNGFSYLAIAVGQSAYGGVIACLNGGLANLITTTDDTSPSTKQWALTDDFNSGTDSITDGASNTLSIYTELTIMSGINPDTYAAGICHTFAIDSQNNTPCVAGNTCYNDWFLPAGSNTTSSGQLNCVMTNQADIGGFNFGIYWSSTQYAGDPFNQAWSQFLAGPELTANKTNLRGVRCVRVFTP